MKATANVNVNPVPRVLVVDDEPIIATLVKRMLASRGEVEIREDFDGAIRHLASDTNVDLVICDLTLRGGSGWNLYAWVTQHRPELLSRIAFITGGAYTQEAQDFLARVQPPCLHKPFTRQELLEFADGLLAPHE